jgi:hypothetical protein
MTLPKIFKEDWLQSFRARDKVAAGNAIGSTQHLTSVVISESVVNLNTNSVIRTSSTVGDGTAASAGILINENGIYACEASQLLSAANVRILKDGSATFSGTITAASGSIGGWTITSDSLYATTTGTIKTASTVGVGSTGVIMDKDGLRGYDSVLGKVFDIPTNGSAPTFSSGVINYSTFEVNTNAVIRTASTVGNGSASSAGVLINNTGFYACEASQTLANANVKILTDGSASFKGTITAASGTIGSFTIGSNYIRTAASGARFVLDYNSANSRILFYDSSGYTRALIGYTAAGSYNNYGFFFKDSSDNYLMRMISNDKIEFGSSGQVYINSSGVVVNAANGIKVLKGYSIYLEENVSGISGTLLFGSEVWAPSIYAQTSQHLYINSYSSIRLRSENDKQSSSLTINGGSGTILSPVEGVITASCLGLGIRNTSPGSYYSDFYQLVVGSGSGAQGITIATGNTSKGSLAFADSTSGTAAYAGLLFYDHSTNAMYMSCNAGGYAGWDFAVDSSIVYVPNRELRVGTDGGGEATIVLYGQASPGLEGGQVQLIGAVGKTSWLFDNYNGGLRMFSGSNVQFNITTTSVTFGNGSNGTTMLVYGGIQVGAASANNQFSTGSSGTSSTTMYIGNRTIDTSASDERKKDFLNQRTEKRSDILKLKVRDYKWKSSYDDDFETVHTGVSAQKAYKVNPAFASRPSDDKRGLWKTNNQDILFAAVDYIQYLEERVSSLEKLLAKAG